MSLRRLKIGTYVAQSPESVPEGQNPYHPIATATLNTPVFDVVHMFSERSISAVPIINEEGIVVNLYETVDVIVSPWLVIQVHSLTQFICRPLSGSEHTSRLTSKSDICQSMP